MGDVADMHLSRGDCLLIAVALAQSADGHDAAIKVGLNHQGHREHSVTGADVVATLRRRNRLRALVVMFNKASNDGGLNNETDDYRTAR